MIEAIEVKRNLIIIMRTQEWPFSPEVKTERDRSKSPKSKTSRPEAPATVL